MAAFPSPSSLSPPEDEEEGTDYSHHHHHQSAGAKAVSALVKGVASSLSPHLRHGHSSSHHHYHGNGPGMEQENKMPSYFSPGGLVKILTNLSIPEEGGEDFLQSYENSSTVNETIAITANATISQSSQSTFKATLYAVIVPVMVFFCVLTCIVNLVIVISARWCRRPMTPTLYYSISLALADAYASFILGLGLALNSLLPFVYDIKSLTKCYALTVEAFRVGGVLVTVCHLLALGINHWIGIVRPLHYAATMTRRTAWIVIILSWCCPILMLLIYYASIPGQGFRSVGCETNHFLKMRTYRVFFASCFFAPLFLLCIIYLHIFIIVRNHQTNPIRYQSTHALKKNVKAALTTVLILGTYIIGWMPATIFNIIACEDCVIHLKDIDEKTKIAVGITVNVLVILKTFVDPIIYAARMSDIQLSLRKMKYACLAFICKPFPCGRSLQPPDYDRGQNGSTVNRTSMFDTNRSMRMSSFGSSTNGSRRATTHHHNQQNASLLNHSPSTHRNQNGLATTSFINHKNQNGSGYSSGNHLLKPQISVKMKGANDFEVEMR